MGDSRAPPASSARGDQETPSRRTRALDLSGSALNFPQLLPERKGNPGPEIKGAVGREAPRRWCVMSERHRVPQESERGSGPLPLAPAHRVFPGETRTVVERASSPNGQPAQASGEGLLLRLQATAGNRAVARLMATGDGRRTNERSGPPLVGPSASLSVTRDSELLLTATARSKAPEFPTVQLQPSAVVQRALSVRQHRVLPRWVSGRSGRSR